IHVGIVVGLARSGGIGRPALTLRSRALVTIATAPAAFVSIATLRARIEHLHISCNNLNDLPLLALRSCPLTGFQATFDVNLAALTKIFIAGLSQALPGNNPEPLGFLRLLPIWRLPGTTHRYREGSNGLAILAVFHLRVLAQVADDHYFVQAPCHLRP